MYCLVVGCGVGVSEEEKQDLGITPALIEFVENVSEHPSTFINFPLEDDEDEVDLLISIERRRQSLSPNPSPRTGKDSLKSSQELEKPVLASSSGGDEKEATSDAAGGGGSPSTTTQSDTPPQPSTPKSGERKRRIARKPFTFSLKQIRHVTAMLKLSANLKRVRLQLIQE